jgi:hypothetical protein
MRIAANEHADEADRPDRPDRPAGAPLRLPVEPDGGIAPWLQHAAFARALRHALQHSAPADASAPRRRAVQCQSHDRADAGARDRERSDVRDERDASTPAPLQALAAKDDPIARAGLAFPSWAAPPQPAARSAHAAQTAAAAAAAAPAPRSRTRAPAAAHTALPLLTAADAAAADSPTTIHFGAAAQQPPLQLELRRSGDGWTLLCRSAADIGSLRAALARLQERFMRLTLGRLHMHVAAPLADEAPSSLARGLAACPSAAQRNRHAS